MKLTVIKFSQRDPKWAQEKLGTSAVTIDLYGCALASLTMIEKYYGMDTDPLRLNQALIDNKVYAERNLMQWWIVNKVNEFVSLKDWIDCVLTPAPMSKVDAELEAGRPCVAHVDLNPNQQGPDHFIVIFGKTEDGHYICYDPWYLNEDAIFFDARYGDPAKGIFRLLFFNGPVPQSEKPKPSVEALNVQVETLKQHIDDVRTALKLPVMADISDITKKITELQGKETEYIKYLEQEKLDIEKPDKKHEGYLFAGKWDVKNLLIEFWKKEVTKND